jgi:hypothetical protein
MKVKKITALARGLEPKGRPSNRIQRTDSEELVADAQASLKQRTALSSQQVVGLQRVIGNQAVQRLLLQRRLFISRGGSALQRVEEGKDYVHSAHSKERMAERNISQVQLERTLDSPDVVNDQGDGTSEYLSQLPSGLICRIIVSNDHPMTLITMMKVRKHKSFKKK